MRALVLGTPLFVLSCIGAYAQSPESILKWKSKALSEIASIDRSSTEDQVLRVSGYLRVAERGEHMTSEHREVVASAQRVLLGLPQLERCFENAIERGIQNEFREAEGKGRLAKEPQVWDVFACLEQLPSPRTVAILGELLEDDRDPWKVVPPGEISQGRPPPNSYLAAKTLNRIGIEGVPIVEIRSGDRDYELARDQWKLWYAAVKAGNRTFRFEGDPREYTLDGPVETAAAATALPPVRSGASPAVPGDAPAAGERGMPWVALAAAFAVLGLAVRAAWIARRKG
jgi:hypothetical protein